MAEIIQTQPAEAIAKTFQVAEVPALTPRYNIAPTQSVTTILQTKVQPDRQLRMLRWGLIPSWAKDKKIGVRLINARAETAAEKPSFRSAFRRRRCLVLADGFYEWRKQGKEQLKQPYYCRLKDGNLFAFAGLWERWQDTTGETIESCTILTTKPNQLMRSIHNRMPVIVQPQDYNLWLDSQVQEMELLQSLLGSYPSEKMMAYPVSKLVNKASNNLAECMQCET
ncbi:MAG: SOS response-associated peptidase [Symploca sp. SIO2C1]|nr:SOS response-associated peptidase [Symploca sp. SIO2C1]